MLKHDVIEQLSGTLFWDVDTRALDERIHQNFIISRVMDRGSLNDVHAVWLHYGADAIRDALLQAPALQRKTIAFFANQFHLRPEDFRAFRKNQEMGTWEH